MRVLHTESSKGWGGQENRTLNELLGMRQLGHEMAVVSQPGARIIDRAKEAGFETFEIPMRGAVDLPAMFKLRKLIMNWRPHIINCHSGRDTQLAGIAARSLGSDRPRIVRTRHLALPITSRFSYSVLPDHVVTVSRYVGDYLISEGVPAEMVSAIPTGVDFSRYQKISTGGTLRSELGLPPETLLVGTVAILRRKKGHLELLEAIPKVLARHPDVHFVFAGDGPMQSQIVEHIHQAGLESRVHLLGLRRDVINVLQSIDLFVLPTHQEALGTAFIEAAAMGLPAIGTNVDGVPEVILDGESGLLVPALDCDLLTKSIIALLDDAELRARMGHFANQRIRQLYSREAMVNGMAQLYTRLLAIKQ
jgi:glycosyltransferase involved in cell wall biosynthesis